MNDDYWCIDFKGGSFYYGYEASRCITCKKQLDSGKEYCEENHETTWCFTGEMGDFKRIYPAYELNKDGFDIAGCMQAGIERFMGEYLSKERKI